MAKKFFVFLLSFLFLISTSFFYKISIKADDGPDDEWFHKQIIVNRTDIGYSDVRVPNVEVTSNGTILLCFEARTGADFSENDIYLYRSYDGGDNWVSENWIEEIPGGHSNSANANPFFLQDDTRDRLYFFMTERKTDVQTSTYMYWRYSDDNGATWSDWTDITSLKPSYVTDADGYAWTGCGGAVSDNGTIYFACSGRDNTDTHYPFVIRSWDGENFHLAGHVRDTGAQEYNEDSLAIQENGSLSMFARDQDSGGIGLFVSHDDGTSWSFDKQLFTAPPAATGSKNHGRTYTKEPTHRMILAFTNSTDRDDITLIVSYDGGYNWSYSQQVHSSEYVCYPSIAFTDNGTILCTYEESHPGVDKIYFTRCNLEWITSSNDYLSEDEEIEFISIDGGTNNTVNRSNNPTINWTVVSNTSQYHLEIDNNSDFSSPEVNYTDINEANYPTNCYINETRVSFILPVSYENYSYYYYRVRAYSI